MGYLANALRPLRIATGKSEAAAQYFLPGRLDEVAVYGSALSAARVRTHYEAGSGALPLAVEQVLIEDWCQQYTTGAPGGLEFGVDGALYMTAGAAEATRSPTTARKAIRRTHAAILPAEWGRPSRRRPPKAAGSVARTFGRAATRVGLGGTLIRVDPATGAGVPRQPSRREHRSERPPDRGARIPQPVPDDDPPRNARRLDR